MKKIDLSFLKHQELPTKEVEVMIQDKIEVITFKPVTGRGLTSLAMIDENDVERNGKMCLIALMNGLGISQEEAEAFMQEELFAADSLAASILQFTSEYQKTLNEAKMQVKKNSKKKTTTPPTK